MAYQTGNISYIGSFKSIRNWKNLKDPKIYAGEKGGANRDLIRHNPAFARTRENMSEFKGCGVVVKAIRIGLLHLILEFADTRFTSRLMKLIKMINVRDWEGVKGKRAIMISLDKPMLKTLNLHEKRKVDFLLKRCITKRHNDSRTQATITINGLNPGPLLVPGNAQYYRVINHLSIISDFAYAENGRKYKPLNPLSQMSAYVYSEYISVNSPLTVELTAAFPEGTVLNDSCTVLQCVGIEFYNRAGVGGFVRYPGGSMLVFDVF